MKIRLNKYISEAGLCSRREADRKIEQGKVRVNGRPASLGDTVDDYDEVLVDGNPVRNRVQRVYLAYNKPVGVTSTTERTDPDNILKAVAYHGGRVFPVGRLDKDSHGLILLTNDGDIVNKVLRVSNAHDKEYLVTVDKPVTTEFVKKMAGGVDILGTRTKPCEVEQITSHGFKIVLHQGLNRQIRRMCKSLGYTVRDLQRVRIMHIKLDGISTGSWRFLNDNEIENLLNKVSDSDDKPAPRRRSGVRKPYAKAGKFSHPEDEEGVSRGRGAKKGGFSAKSGGSARSGASGRSGSAVKTESSAKSGSTTRSGAYVKAGASAKPGSSSRAGSSAKPARGAKPGGSTKPGGGTKPGSSTKSGGNTKPGSSTRPGRATARPGTAGKSGPAKGPRGGASANRTSSGPKTKSGRR